MAYTETTLPFHPHDLFVRQWPAKTPQALVGIIHGMGEHSGRYTHVAEKLNDSGFSVFAYDLPGHGHTKGQRGHVQSYERLLDSVQVALDYFQNEQVGMPVALFGHSMGGNILSNFLIRRKPKAFAAVIQAPWLRMPEPPAALEFAIGKIMNGIYPSLPFSSKLDGALISRDPLEVEKYNQDPLGHDKITPAWFFGAYAAQQYAIDNAGSIAIPVLVMHGTGDKLAAHSGSEAFIKQGGKNFNFRSWPGLYHELHNEPEKHEVLDYWINWLQRHIP